jgi:hypothetical protein
MLYFFCALYNYYKILPLYLSKNPNQFMTQSNNQRLESIQRAKSQYEKGELSKDEYKKILHQHLSELQN